MAAPNYEQIQSFGAVRSKLKQAAVRDFEILLHDGMTQEEVVAAAVAVAEKYSLLGSELGAQWYDLCTELAGIDADPAHLVETEDAEERAGGFAAAVEKNGGAVGDAFKAWLQREIDESIRATGQANLWRDYERGLAPGRWARVPVGDTCAWCLMLASQGAWYLSEKSALGDEAGHYHSDCDCVAVYHATPESIAGYTELERYKSIYYDAENARLANANGREPYPEDLQERIDRARAEHIRKYNEGQTKKKWTKYNETLIVMRYQNGGDGTKRAQPAQPARKEPKLTERERLERDARAVVGNQAKELGISKKEAGERFDKLVGANTDAQLRRYIKRYSK